jgi:hypothetical protein
MSYIVNDILNNQSTIIVDINKANKLYHKICTDYKKANDELYNYPRDLVFLDGGVDKVLTDPYAPAFGLLLKKCLDITNVDTYKEIATIIKQL